MFRGMVRLALVGLGLSVLVAAGCHKHRHHGYVSEVAVYEDYGPVPYGPPPVVPPYGYAAPACGPAVYGGVVYSHSSRHDRPPRYYGRRPSRHHRDRDCDD